MRAPALRLASAAALSLLVLAACGGGDQRQASAPGCERVSAPAPRQVQLRAPGQEVPRGAKLTAVVETSCGTFEIALDSQRSPNTVNSFVYLARKGFYDGLTFHRAVPGFVIQGGDPLGTGTGGPGYRVDEPPPPNLAYTKGVVAMAKSSAEPPGRSGSQFFIVIVADAGLSPDYALVGRVSRGLEVVDRIGQLGTRTEKPRQTVLIRKVTVRGA